MRATLTATALVLVATVLAPVPAATSAPSPTVVIVRFRGAPPPDLAGALLRRIGPAGAWLLRVPPGAAPAAFAAGLAARPDVRYATPPRRWRALVDDPLFGELWGLHNTGQEGGTPDVDIDAPEAWTTTTGDPATLVAIVDEGIDVTHPDLRERIWLNAGELPPPTTDDGDGVLTVADYGTVPDHNGSGTVDAEDLITEYADGVDHDGNGLVDDIAGWDFANGDHTVYDPGECGADPADLHGTHVAGTVAATMDTVGVVGVAPAVRLLPLKFLRCGVGDTVDALDALAYATAAGADIVNASWGGAQDDPALRDALATVGLVVAAAGNDGRDIDTEPTFPASYDLETLVAVAAVDRHGALASFSNFGVTTVDLGAPGVDILSTIVDSGYAELSGTSMAAPHVTGTAALIRAVAPAATPLRLAELLRCSAQPLESLAGRTATGGMVNAAVALALAGRPGPPQELTVTHGDGRLDVGWSTPLHTDGGVDGYHLTLEPGGVSVDVDAATTAWSFTGLDNGVTYTITVAARSGGGLGCAARTSGTPSTVPGAPVDVIPAPDDGHIDVRWSPPVDDGGAPVEAYEVAAEGSDGTHTTRTTTATSTRVGGLTNGVAYTVTVRARNLNGYGPSSAPVGPVVPQGRPGAPEEVTAAPGDRRITVRWAPPANDGGSPIIGYTAIVATADPPTVDVASTDVAGDTTTATITGLINGTAYTVRVVARNAIGEGPASPRVGPVTPFGPPSAPRDPEVRAGNGLVEVYWQPPADDGAGGVAGYEVRVGGQVVRTTVTSVRVTGLANGVPVDGTAAAFNAAGTGPAAALPPTTPEPPPVDRIAGGDRYETAAMLTTATFPDGVHTVFLATGETFPDALAGSAAAVRRRAALLLTHPAVLPPATAGALDLLRPTEVIILGGPSAVGPEVEAAVAALVAGWGGRVGRIAGEDRYHTAALVSAATIDPSPPVVYLATGERFPDALAAAAASGVAAGPVLLTHPTTLPGPVAEELRRLRPTRLVVLGGERAVSPAVVDAAVAAAAPMATERIAGEDRYETAARLAARWYPPYVAVTYLATGERFPDALAGGVAAAAVQAPLLLLPPGGPTAAVEAELGRARPQHIVVLGGEQALLPAAVEAAVAAAS